MTIYQTIQTFIDVAIRNNLLDKTDLLYTRNRLLGILNLQDFDEVGSSDEANLLVLMDQLVAYAEKTGVINGSQKDVEIFEARVMDLLTPLPSVVNQVFWTLYKKDPVKATDYFYQLSQQIDYIKTRNIARNISFVTPSAYGDLEITINLSKPEKDPKEIAKAKTAQVSTYPKCALCLENEGYEGNINHAARQNHRIVRLALNNETYGFQYSPYVYYNEHCIVLNEAHIPMKVDLKCFRNLLTFVEVLPHYFAGSNADLPIVGGSILSHDHYQGGNYIFPMEKAQAYREVKLNGYEDLTIELVNWPMSVLRLRSNHKEQLAEAADYILGKWRHYSDSQLNIIAHSGQTPHNTITPIARRKGQAFEMDLVLRNNRQTDEFPEGIFHPHKDVQNIKKENIGLIEVMGLAILPPRLLEELKPVEKYYAGQGNLEAIAPLHRDWAEKYYVKGSTESGLEQVRRALGATFARILEDAGVYKLDEAGKAGMMRFIDHLNGRD